MATIRPILRLGAADQNRPVSSEAFAEADFAEPWRYERHDGRLIVMAPAGEDHSEVSEEWRDRLGSYRLRSPQVVGRVVSEAWIRVDGGNDRVADIAVYLAVEPPTVARPDRIPEIVFEIVSPDKVSRDRDYLAKRSEYDRLGVLEYVIIDRLDRSVTVLTRSPVGFEERRIEGDQVYEPPLLPGFRVRISDLF